MQWQRTYYETLSGEQKSSFKYFGPGISLTIGIDSDVGNIYCHACDDFVYDPTLETIQQSKRIILGKRKRDVEQAPNANGVENETSPGNNISSTPRATAETCKSAFL